MASIIKLIMKFMARDWGASADSDANAFVVRMCIVLIDNLRVPFIERGTSTVPNPVIKAESIQIITSAYIII